MELPLPLQGPRMQALLLLVIQTAGILVAALGISLSGSGLDADPVFYAGLGIMAATAGLALAASNLRRMVPLHLYLGVSILVLRGLEVAVRHPLLYGIDAWQQLGYASLDIRVGRLVPKYEGGPGHQMWLGTLHYLTGIPLLLLMRFGHLLLVTLVGLIGFLIGRHLGKGALVGLWALLLFALADVVAFLTFPQSTGLLLLASFVLALSYVLPSQRPVQNWTWLLLTLLSYGAVGLTHALSFALAALAAICLLLCGLLRPRRHALLIAGVGLLTLIPFLRLQTQRFATGVLAPLTPPLFGLVGLALITLLSLLPTWWLMERIRPRMVRVLSALAGRVRAGTAGSLGLIVLLAALLVLGIAGGISNLQLGKSSFNLLIDNMFKAMLGAVAVAGLVHYLQAHDRWPGGFLTAWILPFVAVTFMGVFVTYRLDPVRYVLVALLPLGILGGSYITHQWKPRQVAALSLGVLALLPMAYSPLVHSSIGPGETYNLVSEQSYEAARWIAVHGKRPTAVGSDIRLSSLLYGVTPFGVRELCAEGSIIKGTYSYVPEVFTDPEVSNGTKLNIAFKRFDCIGIGYVFYDRDMLTYGANLQYYGSGNTTARILSERDLQKFVTQPIFSEVYDSGNAWVYYVNPRALP